MHFRFALAALVLTSAGPLGCKSDAPVLMPDPPPAPLDRPIGIQDEAPSSSRNDEPAPPIGRIGPAQPLEVIAAAADGQWVALCRLGGHDERDEPLLFIGAESSVAVDRFVAFDPTSRHVALVREGALVLFDAHTGSEIRLRERVFEDGKAVAPAWAAFDPKGKHVAFVAASSEGSSIRVRSLQGRREREIDPGPGGEPVKVELEPGGGVRIGLVTRDVAPADDLRHSPCQPMSASLPEAKLETRFARLDEGGKAQKIPGAIGTWQGGVLVQGADGALVWRRGEQREVWVGPACRGRVLHRDHSERRMLVACEGTSPRSVRVYRASETSDGATVIAHEELGPFTAELDAFEGAWLDAEGGRIFVADPPKMIEVGGVETIVAATSRHALVRRAAAWALVDLVEAKTRELEAPIDASARLLRAGPMVALTADRTWVVDLARGRVHAQTQQTPLAVTRSGYLLVATSDDAARGPLEWIDPRR